MWGDQCWEVIVRTVTMATGITSAEPKVLHMGLALPEKALASPSLSPTGAAVMATIYRAWAWIPDRPVLDMAAWTEA